MKDQKASSPDEERSRGATPRRNPRMSEWLVVEGRGRLGRRGPCQLHLFEYPVHLSGLQRDAALWRWPRRHWCGREVWTRSRSDA